MSDANETKPGEGTTEKAAAEKKPAAETKPAAEEKPAADSKPAGEKKPAGKKRSKDVRILRVVGPERGRRRAGHHFGSEAVDLPIDDLTEEQIAAINADPQLVAAVGMRTEEIEAEDA